VLRIIDYVGPEDAVPDLGPIVQAGMRRTGAEYADVYNWGIDPALFRQAGFSAVDLDGPDIVPDHFEPFEARNISIRFAVKSSRPVVLFTHDTSRSLIKLAARSGVAAFLVAPLQPPQLAPTLDLAVARFEECEVLRRKLADRTVIERAKGRLMASHGLSEDDAFRCLRTRAMATRSTLGDVARDVTENGVAALTPSPADGSALYSQVPMV